MNGRLAEPRTQQQFDAIFEFSSQSNVFWLGGTDLLQEGLWLWNSDNSTIDLTVFWNENEPNNLLNNRPNGENCLEFRDQGLNDEPCERPRPYVCEFADIGEVPVCPS